MMSRHLHAALAALLFLVVACDTDAAPAHRSAAAPLSIAQPADESVPYDCRDASYCYRDCQGAAWLAGTAAVDAHGDCAATCEPETQSGRDHYGWWLIALESQCEDDDSDGCWISAILPDHGCSDLAGVVLDGCLREGASW